MAAARLAYYRNDVARSAETFVRAAAAHPDLLTQPRPCYIAACAAARAGLGRHALTWLRANLRHWQTELAAGGDRSKEVADELRHWQKDKAFRCSKCAKIQSYKWPEPPKKLGWCKSCGSGVAQHHFAICSTPLCGRTTLQNELCTMERNHEKSCANKFGEMEKLRLALDALTNGSTI